MIRPPAAVLLELERESLVVDEAIAGLAWDTCEASWRTQRRLTHELEIALRDVTPGSPDADVTRKRIDRLRRYRDVQLARLRSFNATVATRLANMERFRSFAKTRTTVDRPSLFLDTNS